MSDLGYTKPPGPLLSEIGRIAIATSVLGDYWFCGYATAKSVAAALVSEQRLAGILMAELRAAWESDRSPGKEATFEDYLRREANNLTAALEPANG